MAENDRTQDIARAGVIVAAIRSGGTFLSHCLSNHPQVFCDRGEPLHHRSAWVKALNPDRGSLMAAMWNQSGYRVSLFKLTYTQALHRDIWALLVAKQPLVIWLSRENYVRQAVSVLINKRARAGGIRRPQHTFDVPKPIQVKLRPEQVVIVARNLKAQDGRFRAMMGRLRAVLPLTYDQVVGGEGLSAHEMPDETTDRLCAFLGVPYHPLACDLQRVNAVPLRELVSNWDAVRKAVKGSEFAGLLADEAVWNG